MTRKITRAKNRKIMTFSPVEQRLLAAIPPRGGYITSTSLIKKVYADEMPFHARNSLNTAIRSVALKLMINGDPRRIERTRQAGPHPISIRFVRRRRRATAAAMAAE
ncbi:MAG TPA: hypothetical protein VH854_07405 [Thermoanaerobaculia bacterium]|jgi:hypothetical protein|nr:hypothetical protein [Thermoanaerobaculia bacterium]